MVCERKAPQTEVQTLQKAVEVQRTKEEAMQAVYMKKVNVWRRGHDALGD